MTFWGRVVTFFPLIHFLAVLTAGFALLRTPGCGSLFLLVSALYVFPLLSFRIHNCFFPLREGISRLDLPIYSSWWGSHQFQAVFNACPALEACLRIIPGLYSFWLRLWGSSIGRGVYWTSRVEVMDRSLLEVGYGAILGHKVILISHVIKRKANGKTILYVSKIKIGSQAFIGAGTKLGPGTEITPHQVLPVETLLTVNKKL